MGQSLFLRLIFGATVDEQRRQHAKRLDGKMPAAEQLRQLARMTADAFLVIRIADDIKLANALADAFHNLPIVVSWPDFSWSWLLMFLECFERRHPEVGRRFLAAFDDVVGFNVSP